MRFRNQIMRLSNQMTRMRHQIKRRVFKSNDASSNQMMRLGVLPLLDKPLRQILLRSSSTALRYRGTLGSYISRKLHLTVHFTMLLCRSCCRL